MLNLLRTNIGRLRITGFLEGTSYLLLLFIATPLKYICHNDSWTKVLGAAHGTLFVLFVIYTISVSIEKNWKFTKITWQVLLASVLPFGTFYVDRKILSKIEE